VKNRNISFFANGINVADAVSSGLLKTLYLPELFAQFCLAWTIYINSHIIEQSHAH